MPRRIGERLEVDEIPARRLVDQRLGERGAGAILPARAGQQVEHGRARAGIAHHAELAGVEQRDLDGAPIERREAHDVPGLGAFVRAADEDVELGAERVVIGVPPRDQPVGPAKQRARARAGERPPFSFEGSKRGEVADYRDIDRQAPFERITGGYVADRNGARCACRRAIAFESVHARGNASAVPTRPKRW